MIKILTSFKLGFGTAPLGTMFREIAEEEAHETLEAAWNNGVRYFDTAPLYGAGLAESRLGDALADKPRSEFVISTKVGRVVPADVDRLDLHRPSGDKKPGRRNHISSDYSEDATLRSIDGSLRRLKTDHVEIVLVHDVAQDLHGDTWLNMFESARTGAFRVLDRLRDEGVIRCWGLGVNRVEPIELTLSLEEPRPDVFLLAGRYTLLDHHSALQRVMPKVIEHGLGVIVGAPYNSGALVGGPNFD